VFATLFGLATSLGFGANRQWPVSNFMFGILSDVSKVC
jgi:choline-glycine betaine transporter